MNRTLVFYRFTVFALLVSLIVSAAAHRGPGHTCTLPCTITTGLQEDEVGYDYRHGGTVAVYRVTP